MKKVLVLFLFLFVLVHRNPSNFDYDEFSVVLTFRELIDPYFFSFYYFTLENFLKLSLDKMLVQLFLYFFIVPIRWTYSFLPYPFLGWLSYLDISFNAIYLVVISFNAGLLYAVYSLFYSRANEFERFSVLAFIGLYLMAPVSSYWFLTLSPYGYLLHGLIFALYFSSTGVSSRTRAPLYLSLVGLFSYQFLPALVIQISFLSLYFRRKFGFFSKIFIPSFVLILFLLFFIFIRGFITGLHLDPASAATFDSLSISLSNKYFFWDILSNDKWISYSIERFSDALSFSLLGGVEDTTPWLFSVWLSTLIASAVYLARYSKWGIMLFPASVMVAQLLLFVLNILPITPTRHWILFFSSSLLVILCGVLHFLYYQIIFRYFSMNVFRFVVLAPILIFALIGGLKDKGAIDYSGQIDVIRDYKVEVVFYDGCFNGPLLHYEFFVGFNNFYSCGGRIIKSLDFLPKTFAVFAKGAESTIPDGVDYIKKFSSSPVGEVDFVPVSSHEYSDGTLVRIYGRK